MNIRDFKYLVSLAEQLHFGKAASACFVSQPALSMQIKKLENVLGVQLIERSTKGILLTDVGKIIAQHAKSILQQVTLIREIAKQQQDPYTGELKLGIIPTLAPYLLPFIIPKIAKIFSKVTIFLIEEKTAILLKKLKEGQLDAALLALPVVDLDLIKNFLFEEEFLLAIFPTHHLAKRKKVKLSDLENETLLLLEEGHCMREQTLAICQRNYAAEIKDFRATSLETLRYMTATKNGITLMPKLACKLDNNLKYLPFNDPKPTRKIAIVWRNTTAKKILLTELSAHIKSIMQNRIHY